MQLSAGQTLQFDSVQSITFFKFFYKISIILK